MQTDSEDRLQRKKRLFEFYGPKSKLEDESVGIIHDPKSIDSLDFNSQEYLTDLLRKSDLNDLVAKETEICEQIRSLDSEMQTLVYDNYNKFINATQTIKMMKSNFKFIEEEMNSLAKSMVEIKQLSSDIDEEIRESRSTIKRLTTTAENLQKLGYLSSLPSTMREFIRKEEWEKAVDAYTKAKPFFEKHQNVPSFQGIAEECKELLNEVARAVECRLLSAEDPKCMISPVEILTELGKPKLALAKMFIDVTSKCIDKKFGKLCDLTAENPTGSQPNSVTFDFLNFAIVAADTLSEDVLPFVFVYSSSFLSRKTPSTIEDQEKDLQTPLFEFLQSVTQRFLDLVDAKIQKVVNAEVSVVVRAVERLYARLVEFGRSTLEVAAPDGGGDGGNDAESIASDAVFKRSLDTASLALVLRVAQRYCREKALAALKLQTADCLTDVRQQVVTVFGSMAASSDDHGKHLLTDVYEELSRVLASNLLDCLKKLEVFLEGENTFAHLQSFRARFCLEYVREGLVGAYIRFLVQFCEDLSRCTPVSIPSTIILLMGKLCLDWANSGTVGHLLSLADDFLLIGLSKSSSSRSQQMAAAAAELRGPDAPTLTAAGELAKALREAGTRLLSAYARLEGAAIAHLFRKSVEARDWLRCLEPRSVRSAVRRVLEDLAGIDAQVSQLLPPTSTGRGRGGGGGGGRGSTEGGYSSWRASMSQLRSHVSAMASVGAPTSTTTSGPEYDPALASQLRRLFHQRVDVFTPVEPTRESILFSVIKIGLKAFSECARTRTFGKFGLQQIQVDCHYLHIHLWRFVSEEKQVQNVLDDVMYSVMRRCVDPQLMDDSIVDAICDNSRGSSGLSKARSTVCREIWERRLNLNRLDVDYTIEFERTNRAFVADMTLDGVESRYLLVGNINGSILVYDTEGGRMAKQASAPDAEPSYVVPEVARMRATPADLGTLQQPVSNADDVGAPRPTSCQPLCLHWNPVDTGSFFSVSFDHALRIWDSNAGECVDAVATPEAMTWASVSSRAREHGLVAVGLEKTGERCVACIDPLVGGAPSLSISGGHTHPLVTQVLWSPRNSFVLLSAGADGRVIFWDIRMLLKPVASLNHNYNEGDPIYIPEAQAHTGPAQSMLFSADGLHLITWGRTGGVGTSVLNLWGLEVSGGAPSPVAQPRACRYNLASTAARPSEQPRPLRLAATGAGSVGPRLPAWGAEGAYVFVPAGRSLVVTAFGNQSSGRGNSQWCFTRHFGTMTATVWNPKRLELYTCGLEDNIYTWPLLPCLLSDDAKS